MQLKKKLERYNLQKNSSSSSSTSKPSNNLSNASILFPQIAKELNNNPELSGNLKGLFIISVLKPNASIPIGRGAAATTNAHNNSIHYQNNGNRSNSESIELNGISEDWFLLFQGREVKPIISRQRPTLPSPSSSSSSSHLGSTTNSSTNLSSFPIVLIELDDAHLLNFVTGGLTGIKALTSGQIKIVGDLVLAQALEDVFVKAGGVEKAMEFMKQQKSKL